MRWVVEDLAREEQQHCHMLTEPAARAEIQAQVEAEIATPASDGRFSDAVHIPDLGERPDDQAVLQYAMGRGHLAMEQHRSLAEAAEPGALKELFGFLANEETKHKGELERVYYETVHSGGV